MTNAPTMMLLALLVVVVLVPSAARGISVDGAGGLAVGDVAADSLTVGGVTSTDGITSLAAIGEVEGDETVLLDAAAASGTNTHRLRMRVQRFANGSTWETSRMELAHSVDTSPMAYLRFQDRELHIGIQGDTAAMRVQRGALDQPEIGVVRRLGIARTAAENPFHFDQATDAMLNINLDRLHGNVSSTTTGMLLGAYTTNSDRMRIDLKRDIAGTGWDTASWSLRRTVDVTDIGFVRFGHWEVTIGAGTHPTGTSARFNAGAAYLEKQLILAPGLASSDLCTDAGSVVVACGASNAALKQDVRPLELSMSQLRRLRPVSFAWLDAGRAAGGRDLGFIAEEVLAVSSLLVTRAADGSVNGVRYRQMSAALVAAVQQLADDADRTNAEVKAVRAAAAEDADRCRAAVDAAADRHDAEIAALRTVIARLRDEQQDELAHVRAYAAAAARERDRLQRELDELRNLVMDMQSRSSS